MINRWLVITPLSALPFNRARTTPLLPSPAGPPLSGSHHLQCLHDSSGLPASTLDPLLSTLNTTARGVLLSLNHMLFFSCLPPHLAACPAPWGHVATLDLVTSHSLTSLCSHHTGLFLILLHSHPRASASAVSLHLESSFRHPCEWLPIFLQVSAQMFSDQLLLPPHPRVE